MARPHYSDPLDDFEEEQLEAELGPLDDESDEYVGGGVICDVCGCSDDDPCPEGCSWVGSHLCSRCARR